MKRFVVFALLALFARAANSQGARAGSYGIGHSSPLTPNEVKDLGGATLLTFQGKAVPLSDIIDLFAKTAGLPLTDPQWRGSPEMKATISVDWKDVPFWDAAREVESKTGGIWGFYNGRSPTLTIYKDRGARNLSDLNGHIVGETPLVKIYADTLTHTETKVASLAGRKISKEQTDDLLYLQMSIYLDPKIDMSPGSLQVVGLERDGQKLPYPAGGITYVNYERESPALMDILMVRLDDGLPSGTQLKTLQGKVKITGYVELPAWLVPDIVSSKPQMKSMGFSEYRFTGAELVGGQLKLSTSQSHQVFFASDAAARNSTSPESTLVKRPRTADYVPRVRDVNGHYLKNSGKTPSSLETDRERTGSRTEMTFDLALENGEMAKGPFTLEWPLQPELRDFDVPFELSNLEVP